MRVGKTRKFRKMLLPRKKIKANGRSLDLASMFSDLIKAEREGAFDAIPLQVHETHTKDPRYTEGQVSNLVHLQDGPDGDGLYGDIEFADDKGVDLVRKSSGKVGVSVSMVENLVRDEDGQEHRWPVAMQHVLMTTDPHVRQMGGWHPINLGRADVEDTIDLSNQSYDEIEEEPVTAPTDAPPAEGTENSGMVTLEVTPEQREQLLGLLSDVQTAEAVAGRGSGDEGAPTGETRPEAELVGASTNLDRESAEGGSDEIELMRSEIETERNARIELSRELQRARAASELEALGNTGLAPSIINLARPLLEIERGTGTIELSRGESVDPTRVIREVLNEVIELSRRGAGVIALDTEIGMHIGGEAEQAERAQKLRDLDEMFGTD